MIVLLMAFLASFLVDNHRLPAYFVKLTIYASITARIATMYCLPSAKARHVPFWSLGLARERYDVHKVNATIMEVMGL